MTTEEDLRAYLAKWHPGKWEPLDDQPHHIPFECPACDHRGDTCELLVRDGDQTMRCPKCGSAGWEYI